MDSSEAKKLKQLEEENRKLKHVVADLTLDNRRNPTACVSLPVPSAALAGQCLVPLSVAMFVREGMPANHKRVYRLYREEGLVMRIRQRRRIRWHGAVASSAATRPNQRWSMDFVSDCVSTGKVILKI